MIYLNFTQIECFINVAETLNFSESAQKLHLSQPAVTKNIKQLEQELDASLFNRKQHGVTLTQEGVFFYRNMSDVLFRTNQTIDEIHSNSKQENQYISIGYTNTALEERYLPIVLQNIKHHLSGVQLVLHNFNLNSGIEGLLNRKFDLLLTTQDNVANNSKIKFVPMLNGLFNILIPAGSKLFKKESIDLKDLDNQRLIFFNTRQAPPEQTRMQNDIKHNLKHASFQIADTPNILVTLVKGNAGVGIVPSFIANGSINEIESIPLNYPSELTYGVAYLKGNSSANIDSVIKLIERAIKHL